MKNQAVYVYGFSVPTTTDADGNVTRELDINGNEYVTVFVHGQDEDEDGLFIEPIKAITTLNAGIAPMMYSHLMKQAAKHGTTDATEAERKSANVEDGQPLSILKRSVAFAGVVEKRKSIKPFMIDGSDNVGRFVNLVGWGASEVAVAAVDKQYVERMEYYAAEDSFIEEEDVQAYKDAKTGAAPTKKMQTVIS